MKKRLTGLLACALALGISGATLYGCGGGNNTAKETTVPEQVTQTETSDSYVSAPNVNGDYLSPLVTLRADPYLYKNEGKYYFTGSYPEYDRIELTCADSVNGVAAAVPKMIWQLPENDRPKIVNGNKAFYKYVWAPEIHKIKDTWVIYFTLSDVGLWDIRSCALICQGDDPMHDEWEWAGYMQPVEGDDFSFKTWAFSLDMTAYENNGHWYVIWAQKGPESNLYLAELDADNPNKLLSKPILLTKPEYDWEKLRLSVNEGPAVMKHAGKIYVSYSAAATGYEYCMGLLEINDTDDQLDIKNWKKYSEPVFKTDESRKIYGPGHNCFVEGDEGEQLCVLHFRDYKDIEGDSLLDYNRHAHVMKITFDRNGVPQFNFDPDDLYNTSFNNHVK